MDRIFKKNEEVLVEIDDLGKDGEGIGHIDGYALFIKDALPGETVRAKIMKTKKNYGFARQMEVVKTSPDRVEPACPVARQCGGCTLQHLSYEGQKKFKQKKVLDCLARLGGVELDEVEILPILSMTDEECFEAGLKKQRAIPWHYRNKAQFPVRMNKDGVIVTGFFAGRTHSVIPVTDCQIQAEGMREILEAVLCFMKENGVSAYDEETGTGIIRHIFIRKAFSTSEYMVCLVVNDGLRHFKDKFSTALVKALQEACPTLASVLVNCNKEKTNVIMGEYTELVWGKEKITDKIGDIAYEISAQSFYQVNPAQTVRLYQTALEFADLQGGETVWDMYCGIGTISLFLANSVGANGKVLGVEIVPQAIENAKANAKLNGFTNVEFFCGAAEDVVGSDEVRERVGEMGMKADVVVVDPPRKGCDTTLLHTIGKMAPKKIVYVSCDPATLARDVKILATETKAKYRVEKVRACDMFPQGGHVETVCLLSKKL